MPINSAVKLLPPSILMMATVLFCEKSLTLKYSQKIARKSALKISKLQNCHVTINILTLRHSTHLHTCTLKEFLNSTALETLLESRRNGLKELHQKERFIWNCRYQLSGTIRSSFQGLILIFSLGRHSCPRPRFTNI